MSKSDVAAHCGEFCEVRTAYGAFYGRLLRLNGGVFELEVQDRRGRAVAVFRTDEIAAVTGLPSPHY